MDLSSGSARQSTVNEPDVDHEEHEYTFYCVYLDVDIGGEIHATTAPQIIVMSAAEYPDSRIVKTEVESIHQWKKQP